MVALVFSGRTKRLDTVSVWCTDSMDAYVVPTPNLRGPPGDQSWSSGVSGFGEWSGHGDEQALEYVDDITVAESCNPRSTTSATGLQDSMDVISTRSAANHMTPTWESAWSCSAPLASEFHLHLRCLPMETLCPLWTAQHCWGSRCPLPLSGIGMWEAWSAGPIAKSTSWHYYTSSWRRCPTPHHFLYGVHPPHSLVRRPSVAPRTYSYSETVRRSGEGPTPVPPYHPPRAQWQQSLSCLGPATTLRQMSGAVPQLCQGCLSISGLQRLVPSRQFQTGLPCILPQKQ